MSPITIDEVLTRLDYITSTSIANDDCYGFFAAMYRRVTAAVKADIAAGKFEDGERMECFDVLFANHYLKAYDARRSGKPTTKSWSIAFDIVGFESRTVIQHLLLGMNAHINYDLGLTAAAIGRTPEGLAALRKDYDYINDILEREYAALDGVLNELSPWYGIADALFQDTDEIAIAFSLKRARAEAWAFAERLVLSQNDTLRLAARDTAVTALGNAIAYPKWPLNLMLHVVQLAEPDSNAAITRALAAK